jgi:hypothetical protein
LSRELLTRQSFDSLAELQAALEKYLTFYNNYRRHSALAWQPPATRYTGCALSIRGLAGIPGIEPMAANPQWGEAYADPPIEITAMTASKSRALALA